MTLWASFPRQRLNTKSFCWPVIISLVYKCQLLLAEFPEKELVLCRWEKNTLCPLLAVILFWSTHSWFKTGFRYMESWSRWGWGEYWGLQTTTCHHCAAPFCKNPVQKATSQGSDTQFAVIPRRGPASWVSLLSPSDSFRLSTPGLFESKMPSVKVRWRLHLEILPKSPHRNLISSVNVFEDEAFGKSLSKEERTLSYRTGSLPTSQVLGKVKVTREDQREMLRGHRRVCKHNQSMVCVRVEMSQWSLLTCTRLPWLSAW